jgi:phage anti-repressor protein
MNIQEALVKFEYKEPNIGQIAEYVGFNENEIKMINLFWQSAFNDGWLYLSPYMIKTEMGYKKISSFYVDTLRKHYKKNIDYKEISKDDDLINKYNDFASADSPSLAKPKHTGGTAQKYYAITGETYKKMLMRCCTSKGNEICEYYIKVEKLAKFLKSYIDALHLYILQEQLKENTKQLEEKNKRLNRMNILNIELLSYKKQISKNEIIYIVSNYYYASQGIFKIGRTKCMKTRLTGHNNTHINGDKFKVLKEFKVNNSVNMESNIHSLLNGLLIKGEKEFFMCPFDLLEITLNDIINDNGKYSSAINNIIDIVANLRLNDYNTDDWMRNIDPNIFKEELQLIIPNSNNEIQVKFDISQATDIQKQEFIKQCYESYKNTITEPNMLVWKLFQPVLKQLIKDNNNPITKYKATEWKILYKQC